MKYLLIIILMISVHTFGQIMCLTEQKFEDKEIQVNSKSINDEKIIRINFHYMLKSNGTGNFSEITDGDGRYYSGYDFSRDLLSYMNDQCDINPQLNIPTGNSIPNLAKGYKYVLDAVYFHRDNNNYDYQSITASENITPLGRDSYEVMNIYFTHDIQTMGGSASNISSTSSNKFIECRAVWRSYVETMQFGNNIEDFKWVLARLINHELGHLLTLSHTVRWNYSTPCPTGCPGMIVGGANVSSPIDYSCDDFCSDTPSAWEITLANNCTKHPACGWNTGSIIDCSNNLMDYSGELALSPCQIERIHSALENGLYPYTTCNALGVDKYFADMGYPKTSYFGKSIIVGSTSDFTHITDREKIDLFYSNSVDLNNFEIRADSELEIFLYNNCIWGD